MKKRIPVFSKSVQILSPIEVAIDEMQARICELEEVVRMQPTDLKKLQLKLQGSISVQVCLNLFQLLIVVLFYVCDLWQCYASVFSVLNYFF